MNAAEILEQATRSSFAIWYLIGAALVFFMQCGFAMVETGFTRAKNAGNIIMKNLMDFCIGTVVFILLGFSLMMSENYIAGVIGVPNLQIFTDFSSFMENNASSFVFNLVFCATAATIVSGAMAERTKFAAYCVYSAVISLVVYPIEAGWVWNSQGWLAQLGFIDYAGSCAIHMTGGMAALVGAIILGPRLGKYVTDKNGKVVKVNAIPGHNIPLGALGCFILWFAWYGFNGAAATSVPELGSIFLTTTISPAVATVTTMLFTWLKNGKPDVSMCLNASLAGLVAVTAGCDTVDALGSLIIGVVAGIIVVVVVEALDMKAHIDDPVGAIGVHFANGLWGTLAAGLFSSASAPHGVDGPIYALVHGSSLSAGWKVFGVQCLGVVSICAWDCITMIITFQIIKHTIGLRASQEEEIVGLDKMEHGLPSAYADFTILDSYGAEYLEGVTDVDLSSLEAPAAESSVEVQVAPNVDEETMAKGSPKMTKIEIVCKERNLERLKNAFFQLGITGMTVSHVMGCGVQKGQPEYYRGVPVEASLLPKIRIDVVVCAVPVRSVIESAKKTLYTGHIGDGKIFVYNVENVVKVRTGEEGYDALQDVE